jgi:hypothetical protein
MLAVAVAVELHPLLESMLVGRAVVEMELEHP